MIRRSSSSGNQGFSGESYMACDISRVGINGDSVRSLTMVVFDDVGIVYIGAQLDIWGR